MAEGKEDNQDLELKFRICDGTDICHSTYSSSTTIATVKKKLLAEWPRAEVSDGASVLSDKTVFPKTVDDMKLIHAGRFLENDNTLAESKITIGDLPGEVITIHVVVQPSLGKEKTGKKQREKSKQNSCACSIL